jgi:predicted secreted protein with PEFG-CTERM motif
MISHKTMKSKPFGALFGLLALVAILGVAPAFGQEANEVDIAAGAGASASAACVTTNNCFAPNPLNVAPGTEVEWKNTDTVSHTVTSGKVSDDNAGSLFDSGLIKKGADFKFTFATAGTYDYFCTVHPWMTGQVIVGEAAASTTPATTTPAPTSDATVPEFGPVASIVLAIAVLSVVVFAAKTRVIPRL